MRSSTPSKRPHRMTAPGPRASVATRACVSGTPRGLISRRGRASSGDDAASSARASTSAFITMPGPPPAGVSSTVRCLSVACARMSTHVERPDAGGERLAGEAHAERAREHLREDGEDARAPHGQSSRSASLGGAAAAAKPAASTTIRRPAISTTGTAASVNGSITVAPPCAGFTSIRSPAPKLWTADHACRARCRRRRPRRGRSGRHDRTRRRLGRRQPLARHEELGIGEPLGGVAVARRPRAARPDDPWPARSASISKRAAPSSVSSGP